MLFEQEVNSSNYRDACQKILAAWHQEKYKVFAFRATEPVDDVKSFYEKIFPYLGEPKAYAEDATLERDKQRTGEVWMEVRFDPAIPNAYRHSANAQPLHTDGSYIPGYPTTILCCVANASKGGETVFVDSEVIAADLLRRNKSLFEQVSQQPILHRRSGDQRLSSPLVNKDGKWYVNWNYYCVDGDISKEERIVVEDFQNYLLSSETIRSKLVEVKLAPGDAVFWKDEEVLHGRHSFEATKVSERFIWKCAIAIGESLRAS